MASPVKLAHVVLRTSRPKEMCDWYIEALEGRVAFANESMAFMTYDDEHHRLAFVETGASERPDDRHTGLHHIAFTYASLRNLLDNYRRLAVLGVEPFWCVNHGGTTSMYYADPDGNSVELQIDNFDTVAEVDAFLTSGVFEENPIGTNFDPEELLARLDAGEEARALVRPS
ncbi:VOC family protein [Streptomyces sp. NPDC052023]|uniref:VOC family protein n=1 Tax=Streptomyces sp. NPDC052023 TaxID=3365681 RepID=UPI0037D829A4